MATKQALDAPQGVETMIPLNKLKKSPHNARRTPHGDDAIEALAGSIAHKGLLQNLVVQPEMKADGTPTGYYLVTAGEGRRLALELRAKRREIKRTELVRCIVDAANDALEVSLDENVTRSEMHPADQFEAFRALSEERGWGVEEIAARFGVSAQVVRQRMRLGAVSPRLMALYREGELTLAQLMAFAISEDHARQEQVHETLTTSWERQPHAIRRAMMESHVDADDPRVLFAGDAYVEAGGEVVRDLFTEEGGGYYADVELLERLVVGRLNAVAEEVRREGWAWVEAHLRFPHDHGLRRVYPQHVDLPARDQKRLDRLEVEYAALEERYDEGEDLTDEEEARVREIEAEMLRLADRRRVFDPEAIAAGGVIVSLGHDGHARVERGFLRPDARGDADGDLDDDRFDDEGDDGAPVTFIGDHSSSGEAEANTKPKAGGLSEALVRDLTAHRTQALRLVLGNQPDVALTAVTHALAAQVFFDTTGESCLEIQATLTPLGRHAPGIEDSPAGRAVAERHETWAAEMPADIDGLWTFVASLDGERRMQLLAHCVASTVFAVRQRWERTPGAQTSADRLADATSLDMAEHWQPTAEGYFSRVTRALILEAVREGASDEDATLLAPMKKRGMAEAAERKLAGKRWLPELLRVVQHIDAEEETVPKAA